MRRGRGTTDAASGQVLSAGVSLSPAGAAGASLVVTERARDAGGVVCVPSRPASAVDWLRCFDEQRGRGGAFAITAECNDHTHGVAHRN